MSRDFPLHPDTSDTFDMKFGFPPLNVARPGSISTLAFTTLAEERSERSSTKHPINSQNPLNNKMKSNVENYCKPFETIMSVKS